MHRTNIGLGLLIILEEKIKREMLFDDYFKKTDSM